MDIEQYGTCLLYTSILRFLVDTFACVLHFEFGIAFGAGTAFKGVAQYAVAAVSYTHLDVYKRQVTSCGILPRTGASAHPLSV